MFRKVILSTTAMVLASSMALAAGGKPAERGFPGAERTNEKGNTVPDRTSLDKFNDYHKFGRKADAIAARQALGELGNRSAYVKAFESKLASLRLSSLKDSVGLQELDIALVKALANKDLNSLRSEAEIKEFIDAISEKVLGVKAEKVTECT